MRYSSKFLGSRRCPHAVELLTRLFARAAARGRDKTAPARTLMMKPDLFRVDGLHANGLVSYAFDGKVTTSKSLGEAARVRRNDVRMERFYEYFTLGQRVKLRLAEPVDALL